MAGAAVDRSSYQVVLRPSGTMDAATGVADRDDFLQRLDGIREGAVLLDLTALGRIDSTGLRLLIGCERECRRRALRLAVAVTSPLVLHCIQALRLDRRFDLLRVAAAQP